MWDDMDYDCHGRPEDHEDDPDFQDGFYWSCCDGKIGSRGCVKTKHESEFSGSKYQKAWEREPGSSYQKAWEVRKEGGDQASSEDEDQTSGEDEDQTSSEDEE